jgi:hypothetical protein
MADGPSKGVDPMISASPSLTARLTLALVALLPLAASPLPAAPAKRVAQAPRCGWIVNPTPANWWLVDRDGEWLIGAQGGYQAPGLDNIPDLSEHDWVVTNGASYGYGCACLHADVDRRTKRITRIRDAKQKPLAACRADRRIKRPTG